MLKTLLACALTCLGLIALAPSLARADAEEPTPPQKTLYATDYHMWFSIRISLIDRLGGIPIIDSEEIRAARAEQWWGHPIPARTSSPQSEKR